MTHFYAFLSRMKYIRRWGLMRNTDPENNAEHSAEVAMLAHALALIRNTYFGGTLDAERAAVLALYHDASEIMTGDLPTPIKYYNPEITANYHAVEDIARDKLLALLPPELSAQYDGVLRERPEDAALWRVVKAADKLAAYIKCVEERRAGNTEFRRAEAATLALLREEYDEPEVRWFMENCLGSYALTLDELD